MGRYITMALRFRKSVKLFPGVRVNFGMRGASLNVGPRGASVSISNRGTYGNVSIPGTGLSFRSRLDNSVTKSSLTAHQQRYQKMLEKEQAIQNRASALSQVTLSLQEDGSFIAKNSHGDNLSSYDMRLLWDQHADNVRKWLQEHADEINGDVELITDIHFDTPSPFSYPECPKLQFDAVEPEKPEPIKSYPRPSKPDYPKLGIFRRLLRKNVDDHKKRIALIDQNYLNELKNWQDAEDLNKAQYLNMVNEWKQNLAKWEAAYKNHQESQINFEKEFPQLLRKDTDLMEEILQFAFNSLVWPRETNVSFLINDQGESIWIDVDLPEIEDLPQRIASIAANGRKLLIKPKPKTHLQRQYARHVHGIIFRLAGTVFASLPAAKTAIISGYSQRLRNETGHIEDEYLLSVIFTRENIESLNFDNLSAIDPIQAIAQFQNICKMSSSLLFKSIKPFTPDTI